MLRNLRFTTTAGRALALFPAAALCALLASSCGEGRAAASPPAVPVYKPAARFTTTTRIPAPAPAVIVATNETGVITSVQCGTCHATRTPNPLAAAAADLDLFHQGLAIAHGGLTCLSCHDASNYDQFKLASGLSANHDTLMTLCAQCHGPQMRDYNHGAHGGMSGHWDLSTGGRVRNSCLACHDPHVPKYQGALPAPPPVDRFMQTHSGAAAHE
ncbi:MAG: hypothetical protein U1F87_12805 [Kiritimatiellia bacterium]